MLELAKISSERFATMSGRTLAHAASALAIAAGIALQPSAAAQLQLNEFMAHGSDHRTRLDSNGRQVVGVGVQWQAQNPARPHLAPRVEAPGRHGLCGERVAERTAHLPAHRAQPGLWSGVSAPSFAFKRLGTHQAIDIGGAMTI